MKKTAWNKGLKMPQIKVNKNLLYKLYVKEKKIISDVAKAMGLKISTTRKRLIQYGWKRNRSEAMMGHKISKETKRKISRSLIGNKAWNKGLTKHDDSRIKKSSGSWKKGNMPWNKGGKNLQIPWNKGKKFMALDKNPNWKGGKSFEPYNYEFNGEKKEFVREKDKYRCRECGISQEKHLLRYRGKLNIHHIDYNKKNNSLKNLITLCKICNSKVNFNRNYWTKYYIEKQKKIIGGINVAYS